ncbi:hypothetical protein WOC76_15505 [Methylocystis sp. IM3]|uniref:hypothetical protein n=1 Tax=unclassified Methylocystis TaxID=2625913 RepID=UPI0030F4C669
MTRLLLTEQPARRGFLRSLVMAPAAALATHRLILPNKDSPEDRARRAWADFSAAMREMTADAKGWRISGAGEVKPFRDRPAMAWLNVHTTHYIADLDPRTPRGIIETWRRFPL